MKIIGIENNFAWHNKDLPDALYTLDRPAVFSKADSALLKDGKPFFVPEWTQECRAGACIVVRISRLGKCIPQRFAHRYYDAVTVGVDFTAADLWTAQRSQGLPWELSKGFDGSATIGRMVPLEGRNVGALNFDLCLDGREVQHGNTAHWRFAIDEVIAYVSTYYTLRQGDLIFTGSPTPPVAVALDQHVVGHLDDEAVLSFNIK